MSMGLERAIGEAIRREAAGIERALIQGLGVSATLVANPAQVLEEGWVAGRKVFRSIFVPLGMAYVIDTAILDLKGGLGLRGLGSL